MTESNELVLRHLKTALETALSDIEWASHLESEVHSVYKVKRLVLAGLDIVNNDLADLPEDYLHPDFSDDEMEW
jgi:hypothetical protein